MDKQSLRKDYLAQRKALGDTELALRNAGIFRLFREFVAKNSDLTTYHCFLPIEKNNEVATWPLIDSLKESEKRIVVSKSELSSNVMTNYLLEDDVQLTTNQWGIPEPVGGKIIADHEIDVVLLPLLIFDKKGHRVGYGKGYYDRFLEACRPDVIKAGVSLFPPVKEITGIEKHDFPMDLCITPDTIYQF